MPYTWRKKSIFFKAIFYVKVAFFVCFSGGALAHPFAESPNWQAIVHYQFHLSGIKSSLDSPSFFLAPDGKTNPQTELQATLDLFHSQDAKRCLFPARYRLLKQAGFSLPPFPRCPDFEQFKKDLNYQKLTLLYTDAYMNNPASLFGHTLLRIDIPPEKKTQLMAHGANYGAFIPPDTNGMLFAILGLTGGYYGGFTVKPYYDIIRTYNNIENRDIWEFQLSLTPEEMDLFVEHLWEIGHTQTKYYFFSKNCSYLLMEVFDAVRPSLKLAQQFPAQTIPLDTVKAVSNANLIQETTYRPSRQKRLQHYFEGQSALGKKRLLDFAETYQINEEGLNAEERALLLQTAYEYLQYQWEAQRIPLTVFRKASFDVLRRRSALDVQEVSSSPITPSSPIQSHHAKRLVFRLGSVHKKSFQSLQFRPAYHDLTDPDEGLLKGAEINFLKTTIRKYTHKNTIHLENLTLVGITSLYPISPLFHPISYTVNAQIGRLYNPKKKTENTAFQFQGGTGGTYAFSKKFWVFFFLKGIGSYGGAFPSNGSIGVGPYLGLLGDFGHFKILGEGTKFWGTTGAAETIFRATAAVKLRTNLGLEGTLSSHTRLHRHWTEASLGIRLYF